MIIGLAVLIMMPCQGFGTEFSADLIRNSGGDEEISKVFIKGKLRREEVKEDGELSVINITRPDKGVAWNLMPEDRMYIEIPLAGMTPGAMENIEDLESSAKMRALGKETVSGYPCEKRRYDSSEEGQGAVVTVWYSSELDYPVKIHVQAFGGEEEMVLEFQNIKTDNIPDSMFEIPEGYMKFGIPGMPEGLSEQLSEMFGGGE